MPDEDKPLLFTNEELRRQIIEDDGIHPISKTLFTGIEGVSSKLLSETVKILVPGGLPTDPLDTILPILSVAAKKLDPEFPDGAVKITQSVGKLVALTFAAGLPGLGIGVTNLLLTIVTVLDTTESEAKRKRAEEIADHIIEMRQRIIEKVEAKKLRLNMPLPVVDLDDRDEEAYYVIGALKFSVGDHARARNVLNECPTYEGFTIRDLELRDVALFYWMYPNICEKWALMSHKGVDSWYSSDVEKAVKAYYSKLAGIRDASLEIPDELLVSESVFVPNFKQKYLAKMPNQSA